MTLCEEGKRISKEVSGFIGNVSEVKEESITDYLIWKWRELNSRLNFIDVSAFTKEEENKRTGADFELELWLVQRGQAVPLLIQAKKFIKPVRTPWRSPPGPARAPARRHGDDDDDDVLS